MPSTVLGPAWNASAPPVTTPAAPQARPTQRGGGRLFGLIMLICLPLAIAGAGVGWFVGRPSGNGSTAGATTTLAAQPTPTPTTLVTPPAPNPSTTLFTLPQTAAGLKLTPDPQFSQAIGGMVPPALAGSVVAGLYTDPTNDNKRLVLIGLDDPNPSPATTLDLLLDGFNSSSPVKLGTPKEYSPGPMGGFMKCASGQQSTPSGTITLAVCGVSDSHGVMIAEFADRSLSSAVSATRTLRPTFEHP